MKDILFKEDSFVFSSRVSGILVHDGKVLVSAADCSTQVCVRSRAISRVGESIVCAPHGLVVTVVGESTETVLDLIVR